MPRPRKSILVHIYESDTLTDWQEIKDRVRESGGHYLRLIVAKKYDFYGDPVGHIYLHVYQGEDSIRRVDGSKSTTY